MVNSGTTEQSFLGNYKAHDSSCQQKWKSKEILAMGAEPRVESRLPRTNPRLTLHFLPSALRSNLAKNNR